MPSRAEVAKVIDHSVLKPFFTDKDVVAHCQMCVRRGVGNICVRPTDVALVATETKGTGMAIAAVVGFPHGSNRSEVKALEAELALRDGAVELDMVMNVGKFLSGDSAFVQRDIEAVVAVARKHHALVKVILETSLLTPDQVVKACRIAEAAQADFVKTSTGFAEGGGGATPEVIALMLQTVGKTLKVKASGGVRSWEAAVGYLQQGCARLGVGSTEKVLDGAPDAGGS